MLNFIFPVSFALFSIFFLILSNNKKNYQKLVENGGEKFANNVNKGLKICGYLLLVCSLFWLAGNFI
jgi:hypothetical protein